MKGIMIGFGLSLIQNIYYDHVRRKRQEIFNNKMILYLKEKEKNLSHKYICQDQKTKNYIKK
jgi:hypothetical protein